MRLTRFRAVSVGLWGRDTSKEISPAPRRLGTPPGISTDLAAELEKVPLVAGVKLFLHPPTMRLPDKKQGRPAEE